MQGMHCLVTNLEIALDILEFDNDFLVLINSLYFFLLFPFGPGANGLCSLSEELFASVSSVTGVAMPVITL